MEGGDTYYKLFKSCFDGDLEGAANALALGGSVSWRFYENTPLLYAAKHRHTDLCGLLLAGIRQQCEFAELCRKNTPVYSLPGRTLALCSHAHAIISNV